MSTLSRLPATLSLLFFLVPSSVTVGWAAGAHEVNVSVTRYDKPQEPVPDLEVSAQGFGCRLSKLQPGRTDPQGNAVLRFTSDGTPPQLHFFITSNNPQLKDPQKWFLLTHGLLPKSALGKPFTVAGPGANTGLLACQQAELGKAVANTLWKDRSSTLLSSIASGYVLLPSPAAPASQLPDPSQATTQMKGVSKELGGLLPDLLPTWRQLITPAPADEKLDEKHLLALSEADLSTATTYAVRAAKLPLERRIALLPVVIDPSRLVATSIQIYRVQLQTPDLGLTAAQNARIQADLDSLRKSLPENLLPIFESKIEPADIQRLRPFSQAARDKMR